MKNKKSIFFNKSILLISPEPWNGIFVSKHHYSIELARRGGAVFFLNPPDRAIKGRVKINASEEVENLYIVNYKPLFRGLQHLPNFITRYLERLQFRLLERRAKTTFDIVWNFENSRFYNFGFLAQHVLRIYHQVDLNQHFRPVTATQTADIVFCATDFIKQGIDIYNKATFKINHGFSGHLGNTAKVILEENEYFFQEGKKIRACYIGNLDIPYLHIKLIKRLIIENPEVEFLFVGPYDKEGAFFNELGSYKNVVLEGLVKASVIPKYLDDSDILLLIYKSEEFREQLSNPHKMMEYLASGKIIVATYTDEYKSFRNLLLMADNSEEIPALFNLAKSKLPFYNSVQFMRDRITFALSNTYENQVNKIEYLTRQNCENKIIGSSATRKSYLRKEAAKSIQRPFLRGKNILIISPEPWNYIFVSKHHYAIELASNGNKVYFLNPADKSLNDIVYKEVADNLFVVDYKNPYLGVRFLPKAIRKYLNGLVYNRIQHVVQTRFDVVILFENSRFYDLDFLPRDVLSIYFQVDEDQNFHPAIAAKTADIAIAINDIIQKILSRHRKPVFKIPHGFSGRFSRNTLQIWNGQQIYKKQTDRIKAYYVGNLDHGFIDTELLTSLICEEQGVDFFLVGPYSLTGKFYSLIRNCKNVQYLGKVPADSIPELLDDADVLFFAYREDFLSSSHKIMEYLASGKAIVTTKVLGYPEDQDLFYCSRSREKFIEVFREVVFNIEGANSPDKMKKRIQFAMNNTYKERIRQIEELISQV